MPANKQPISPLICRSLSCPPLMESSFACMERLAETVPPPSGSYLLPAGQTAGRGQRGNSWYATPGQNLLPTFYFSGWGLGAKEGFVVSELVALAVCHTIEHLLPVTPLIKWPNDIYLGQEKVAGILIAHGLQGTLINHSIVGIGLNVNELSFPSEIPNPISLRQLAGQPLALPEVEQILCLSLEQLHDTYIMRNRFALLHEDYLSRLFRLGERHLFVLFTKGKREQVPATLETVTPEGLLQLLFEGGERRLFGFQEVSFVL